MTAIVKHKLRTSKAAYVAFVSFMEICLSQANPGYLLK